MGFSLSFTMCEGRFPVVTTWRPHPLALATSVYLAGSYCTDVSWMGESRLYVAVDGHVAIAICSMFDYSSCWSSQMLEFRPNGENVEICEIWRKTIFWKNCSILGLRGTKRSVLFPRAQKTYFEPPQVGRNTKTATPFFDFSKICDFEALF